MRMMFRSTGFLVLIFIMLACSGQEQAIAPVIDPTSTPESLLPPGPARNEATLIPAMPLPVITPTMGAYPSWAGEFAEPILSGLVGRRPDFQDDFNNLNLGWYYHADEDPYTRYYAAINDGVLSLQVPNRADRKEAFAYNPALSRPNFVFETTIRFAKTEPGDTVRITFAPSDGHEALVDISKNESWVFRWFMNGGWTASEGGYDQFPPQEIKIRLISHDGKCAVYLNDTPLAYSDACVKSSLNGRVSRESLSIRLITDGSHEAEVLVDRVVFWDLDAPAYFPAHP